MFTLDECILELLSHVNKFSRALTQIWAILDSELSIESSALDIQRECREFFTDLQILNNRIKEDIKDIQNGLNQDSGLSRIQITNSNINLRDLALTCDQVFRRYNRFPRKDIEVLRKELDIFVQSIRNLGQVLQQYNNQDSWFKLIDFSKEYDFLNRVINLKFNIVDPVKISLQDFLDKYPETTDLEFLDYLQDLKDDLQDRLEIEWLNILNQYSETVD